MLEIPEILEIPTEGESNYVLEKGMQDLLSSTRKGITAQLTGGATGNESIFPQEGWTSDLDTWPTQKMEVEWGELVLAERYVIGKKIGEGGFGKVFEAYDKDAGQMMAIKLVYADKKIEEKNTEIRKKREQDAQSMIEAFGREARIMANHNHPGISKIIDVGKYTSKDVIGENIYYIVMPMGESVLSDKYVETANKPKEEKIEWIRKIMVPLLEALAQINRNYVHLDIKPPNILLDKDGNPKLIDFGLITDLSEGEKTLPSGSVMGTYGFMAPEQVTGKDEWWTVSVDESTDLFELAATIYFILTGKHVYKENVLNTGRLKQEMMMLRGDSGKSEGLRQKRKQEMQKTLQEHQVTESVAGVLLKMLEGRKEHRYVDSASVRRAIREALDEDEKKLKIAKIEKLAVGDKISIKDASTNYRDVKTFKVIKVEDGEITLEEVLEEATKGGAYSRAISLKVLMQQPETVESVVDLEEQNKQKEGLDDFDRFLDEKYAMN